MAKDNDCEKKLKNTYKYIYLQNIIVCMCLYVWVYV